MTKQDREPPYDAAEDDEGGGDADLILEACKASPTFRNRYDLARLETVGGGQFAIVLKAFAKPWGKFVAAKVMYKRPSEAMREKAKREALCAEAITGSGSEKVVRVYGPHETETLFWIEMELVEGGNLQKLLRDAVEKNEPIPFERALNIACAVGEAVQAAHRANVIHRDIKPANILIPADGRPAAKLGDFGISKIAEISKLSRTGGVPGTPLYMPPEIRRGEKFSKAGDIYSLGMVLYKLFTGHLPLPINEDHNEAQVAYIHDSVKPTPPREYKPDLPPEIQDLLVRALSKRPEQRPTADEVVETLHAALATIPTQRVDAAAATGAGSRRNVLAGVGLAAAVLAVALVVRGRGPAAPAAVRGAPAGSDSAAGAPSTPKAPTPTTVAAPAPALRRLFRVAFDRGELSVTNASAEPITDLEVTLVGPDAARYTANLSGSIRADESALFSGDQFTPPLPTNLAPDKAEITAKGPEGRRSSVLPLR